MRAVGGRVGPARDHAVDEARHPVVGRGEEDRGGGQRETEQDELEALRRAPPIAIGPRRFGARGGALPDVELRDHAAGSLLVRARISARGPSATMRPPSMTMMRSHSWRIASRWVAMISVCDLTTDRKSTRLNSSH